MSLKDTLTADMKSALKAGEKVPARSGVIAAPVICRSAPFCSMLTVPWSEVRRPSLVLPSPMVPPTAFNAGKSSCVCSGATEGPMGRPESMSARNPLNGQATQRRLQTTKQSPPSQIR